MLLRRLADHIDNLTDIVIANVVKQSAIRWDCFVLLYRTRNDVLMCIIIAIRQPADEAIC